ncbi:sigma 54-interacting transcriptional regulator [Aromatoleum anaerobium]|nr:sigma 54-interacting transcriptional regulator [Aromatoleum anaerobium]
MFLDEVGDLATPAQAKLLRVLEEQEFERVGGMRSVQVDVRVIAATNRDLADMVRDGAFRVDLYYRLNVFPIPLPPLRERRSDIPLLVRFFADRFARKMGKTIPGIDPRSLQRLTEYAWPGNVRELQNVVERAVILARGGLLDVEVALQRRFDEPLQEAHDPLRQNASGTLEAMERTYIRQILEDRDWIIEGPRGAAALLGLKPSTLRSRMRKLHIGRQSSLPGGAPRDGLAQRQQGF